MSLYTESAASSAAGTSGKRNNNRRPDGKEQQQQGDGHGRCVKMDIRGRGHNVFGGNIGNTSVHYHGKP